MSWGLSRFRTGDLVQVRTKEEILATLDAGGSLDGMPFMPEMLQYCGQTFEIGAVAHKTCETALRTWQGRRLERTVHVAELRCDGSAHGGCQADCRLFWKDEWLRPAGESAKASSARPLPTSAPRCDEAALLASTQLPETAGEPTRYSCQATRLFEATAPLRWWDPRQYFLDVTTGNHSAGEVLKALWLASMRAWLRRTPVGYRFIKTIRETSHRLLVGGEVPDIQGAIPENQPTPTGRLDLRAGELVRIKSKRDILATVSGTKNRGLSFDQEMVRYCGSVATVKTSVTDIIHERTGEMIRMKQPCIILDKVVCTGQYSSCRLMCPRELPQFWRELWLERVNEPALSEGASDSRTQRRIDAEAVPNSASRGAS